MVFALFSTFCAILLHKTDGSHTSRPFFRCKLDVREAAFCPKSPPQPLCLLFLFFKKRNRSPSFLFRRKEAKENHLRNVYFPLLLTVSPTCSAKRTAHIRAGRFFVSSWLCAKTPSVRNIPPQPRCLLFLFFKKRNRSLKEIVPPSKLHEKAGRSFLSGLLCFAFAYSRMSDTTPDATVRPPSRIAKRSPFSIAIGVISVISMRMLSPGMTISTPSGSLIVPVTSVVRK